MERLAQYRAAALACCGCTVLTSPAETPERGGWVAPVNGKAFAAGNNSGLIGAATILVLGGGKFTIALVARHARRGERVVWVLDDREREAEWREARPAGCWVVCS
jgi:hypothetical protein